MTLFYFTGTGNSLAVAKQIGGNLISIPQIIDSDDLNYKDDAIGIVFPIYSFREPKMVRSFLEKANFETEYLFAIGTYGNMPGATMQNLQKRAGNGGYRFDYLNHIVMVDNFLPVFEIGKQIKTLPKKNVNENLIKIVTDIKNRKRFIPKAGLGAKILTPIVSASTPSGESAKKYEIIDSCNNCGICATVCPSKNITVTEAVVFHNRCEGCLACVHLCSKNAIHLKNEKSNKRWRNPDVSLKETIEANNRLKG